MTVATFIGMSAIVVTVLIFMAGAIVSIIKSLINKLMGVLEAKLVDIDHAIVSLRDEIKSHREFNERSHVEMWKEINKIKQAHAATHGKSIDE